jgi:hypothetical protein
MKHILLASVALCAALSGCAVLNQEVAPRVAKAVNVYCLEPQASRQLIRAQVNQMVAPNQIRVDCSGDQ